MRPDLLSEIKAIISDTRRSIIDVRSILVRHSFR
jgi:hypothetical protein